MLYVSFIYINDANISATSYLIYSVLGNPGSCSLRWESGINTSLWFSPRPPLTLADRHPTAWVTIQWCLQQYRVDRLCDAGFLDLCASAAFMSAALGVVSTLRLAPLCLCACTLVMWVILLAFSPLTSRDGRRGEEQENKFRSSHRLSARRGWEYHLFCFCASCLFWMSANHGRKGSVVLLAQLRVGAWSGLPPYAPQCQTHESQ